MGKLLRPLVAFACKKDSDEWDASPGRPFNENGPRVELVSCSKLASAGTFDWSGVKEGQLVTSATLREGSTFSGSRLALSLPRKLPGLSLLAPVSSSVGLGEPLSSKKSADAMRAARNAVVCADPTHPSGFTCEVYPQETLDMIAEWTESSCFPVADEDANGDAKDGGFVTKNASARGRYLTISVAAGPTSVSGTATSCHLILQPIGAAEEALGEPAGPASGAGGADVVPIHDKVASSLAGAERALVEACGSMDHTCNQFLSQVAAMTAVGGEPWLASPIRKRRMLDDETDASLVSVAHKKVSASVVDIMSKALDNASETAEHPLLPAASSVRNSWMRVTGIA